MAPAKKTVAQSIKADTCPENSSPSTVSREEHWRREIEKPPLTQEVMDQMTQPLNDARAVINPDELSQAAIAAAQDAWIQMNFSNQYRIKSELDLLKDAFEDFRARHRLGEELWQLLREKLPLYFQECRLLPEKPSFKVLKIDQVKKLFRGECDIADLILNKGLPFFVSRASDSWLPKTPGEDLEYENFIGFVNKKKITYEGLDSNQGRLFFSEADLEQLAKTNPSLLKKIFEPKTNPKARGGGRTNNKKSAAPAKLPQEPNKSHTLLIDAKSYETTIKGEAERPAAGKSEVRSGPPANNEPVNIRVSIVRSMIHSRNDFSDHEKVKALAQKLDSAGIKLPLRRGPQKSRSEPKTFAEAAGKPTSLEYKRLFDPRNGVLARDLAKR